MKNANTTPEFSHITLCTDNGNFKFVAHHNAPGIHPYDALNIFFSCNWEMLTETGPESYIVYLVDAEPVTFEGDNAAAKLALFMEDYK